MRATQSVYSAEKRLRQYKSLTLAFAFIVVIVFCMISVSADLGYKDSTYPSLDLPRKMPPINSSAGPQGPPGPTGPTGPAGPQGPAGDSNALSSCKDINVPGYYYLIQDIVGTADPCINITANNVILNGNGFNVTASGIGIQVLSSNNIIKNIKIYAVSDGLLLNYANNNQILNVMSSSNSAGNGFYIYRSDNNFISDVTANNNYYYGLDMYGANNNYINNLRTSGNRLGSYFAGGWFSGTGTTLAYNNSFGQIVFTGDLTGTINNNLSFPGCINILDNFASVNTTMCPNLLMSGDITLSKSGYYYNPIILDHGITCFPPDCNLISTNRNSVTFNVPDVVGEYSLLFDVSFVNLTAQNITAKQYCNSTGTCKDLSLWGGSSSMSYSNLALTNQSNDFGSNNITTTSYGFFGYLGSVISRITSIFATTINVQNINMNETVGACNLVINHSICSNASGTYIVG